MATTRVKRDIDWFFETPPTGAPIEGVQPWSSGTDATPTVNVVTSGLPNKFLVLEVYWENSLPATSPTNPVLNGQIGTLMASNVVDNGSFENGISFFYWDDTQIQAITAISNNPTLSLTWTNGLPAEFQFSYVQYSNVAQSSFEIDSGLQSNAGNLSFTDSLNVEEGGVFLVSNISGNPATSTVTTLTPFSVVVDDINGSSQNANVWEQFSAADGSESFTFSITGSNRTLVTYITLRKA